MRLKGRNCVKPSALVHRKHSAEVSPSDFVLFFSYHFSFLINSNAWRRAAVDVEKAMAPHSSTLAWKIHGWRSLEGCSPWGRKELDTTERLRFHVSLSCIGEGNGNPLQCSCLENPREPGRLPSMGSHRVRHDWSNLAAAAAAVDEAEDVVMVINEQQVNMNIFGHYSFCMDVNYLKKILGGQPKAILYMLRSWK